MATMSRPHAVSIDDSLRGLLEFDMESEVAKAYVALVQHDQFATAIFDVVRGNYSSHIVRVDGHRNLSGSVATNIATMDMRGLCGDAQCMEKPALRLGRSELETLFDRTPFWWMERHQAMLAWMEERGRISLTAFTRIEEGGRGVRSSSTHHTTASSDVHSVVQNGRSVSETVEALTAWLGPALHAVLQQIQPCVTQLMVVPCPSLHATPLQLLLLEDGTTRLLDRFELVFCPSPVFLQVLADRTNRPPSEASDAAPSLVLATSMEHTDFGELHHVRAEVACVERAFQSRCLHVQHATAPQHLDRLSVLDEVPAMLSIHCHGVSDYLCPDENRLIMQGKGAGKHHQRLNELDRAIFPGPQDGTRRVEAIFVDLHAELMLKLCASQRPTDTNIQKQIDAVLDETKTTLHQFGRRRHPCCLEATKREFRKYLMSLHGTTRFDARVSKDELRLVRNFLDALWADREDAVRARMVRCIEAGLDRPQLLSAVFQELYCPENVYASDILRYVRLHGCQLACLWACDSGLLKHNPASLSQQLPNLPGGINPTGRMRVLDRMELQKHIVHHLPVSVLLAGCNSVISHLWEVYDCSSLLLVDRFVRLLIEGQLPISRCLQQAQQFVRECTVSQVRQAERRMQKEGIKIVVELPDECRAKPYPFADVKFWGGYQLTGAARAFKALLLAQTPSMPSAVRT